MQNKMTIALQSLAEDIFNVFNLGCYSKIIMIADTGGSMPAFRREVAELEAGLKKGTSVSQFQSWKIQMLDGVARLTNAIQTVEPVRPQNAFAEGGNLIFVITDRAGNLWRDNASTWMQTWGNNNFVSIISVFPERRSLYLPPTDNQQDLTNCDYSFDRRLISCENMVNNRLPKPERIWWVAPEGSSKADFMRVPLISLDPLSLVTWGRFMGRRSRTRGLLYIDSVALAHWSPDEPQKAKDESVKSRLSSFYWTCPAAFELAMHLSFAGPATIELMEAVQQRFLPGTESHVLADIILAGLFAPIEHSRDNPEILIYQLDEEVAKDLGRRAYPSLPGLVVEFITDYYRATYPDFSLRDWRSLAAKGEPMKVDKPLIGFARGLVRAYAWYYGIIPEDKAESFITFYDQLEQQ